MFTLKRTPKEDWRTITIGTDSLRVLVRQPSYADKLTAHGMAVAINDSVSPEDAASESSALTAHRIATSIVGWQDVQDEAGQPVPFSAAAMADLCGQCAPLFYELMGLASEAYSGLETDAEKNLPKPSADSAETTAGTATNASTEPSTSSSV